MYIPNIAPLVQNGTEKSYSIKKGRRQVIFVKYFRSVGSLFNGKGRHQVKKTGQNRDVPERKQKDQGEELTLQNSLARRRLQCFQCNRVMERAEYL